MEGGSYTVSQKQHGERRNIVGVVREIHTGSSVLPISKLSQLTVGLTERDPNKSNRLDRLQTDCVDMII